MEIMPERIGCLVDGGHGRVLVAWGEPPTSLNTAMTARRSHSPAPNSTNGFTFLELIVAVALGVLLVWLALPAYHRVIAELELRDRVEAITHAMAFARAEALKRGHRVNLCPSGDGTSCAEDGRWEQGWILFSDDDGNGDRGEDEQVIRSEPRSLRAITLRGNRPLKDYVSYTSHGQTRMANGALQMGTFTVCRSGRNATEVILANGGRVRVVRTAVPCL